MSIRLDRVLSDGRAMICKDGVYLSLTPKDASDLIDILSGYLLNTDAEWINITSKQLDTMLQDYQGASDDL